MHSGESDFDPPRFKPNPSVYLKAAETEGKEPANCIAVEDSGSGVGSASNAGVGEYCNDHGLDVGMYRSAVLGQTGSVGEKKHTFWYP